MNLKPGQISANESNPAKLRADSCLACLLFQDALVASSLLGARVQFEPHVVILRRYFGGMGKN